MKDHSLSERDIKEEEKEDTGNINEYPNRNGTGVLLGRYILEFKSGSQIVNSEKPLHLPKKNTEKHFNKYVSIGV